MNEKEILRQLKKYSKKVNLSFSENWFKFIWITKEQEILTEYLSDCKDPIYEKYGSKISGRVKNLEKFYNSKDYKNCIKRYGGQIINKESISDLKCIFEKLKNKNIKTILLDFLERIDKNISNLDKIAALTETDIKSEKEHLITGILRHEWIHVLLEKNNLESKNWKYNEGLVTYIEFSLDKKLGELEKYEKNEKYGFQKEYFTNAIIFRDLLKNIKNANKFGKIKVSI